jgi:putative ABC transport system permease protein
MRKARTSTSSSAAGGKIVMGTLELVIREITHRKGSFALALLGVLVAVTLVVFVFTAGEASRLETARITRDLGLNLRIIHRDTNMDRFFIEGSSDQTMPEEYVHQMAKVSGLGYSHLLPMLQKRVRWGETEIILKGVLPEISPVDQRQPSMSLSVKPGEAAVGFQVAARHGLKKGDVIDLLGRRLTVVKCLPEAGTEDDIRVHAHLQDVQAMLGQPGRINEIQALNCLCFDTKLDALEALRQRLKPVLPEAKVLQLTTIAAGRESQRRMIEDQLAFSLPFVMAMCAVWVGVLAMINVRERRTEIGLLRALGYGSGRIASLFLGRAAMVGLVGGGLGFAAGTAVALVWGPAVYRMTGGRLEPLYGLLIWAVPGAIGLAMVASLIPAMMAIVQDPAVALREE